jgi:hypothetical protein
MMHPEYAACLMIRKGDVLTWEQRVLKKYKIDQREIEDIQ